MPFDNVWNGATGNLTLVTNWDQINARTAAWSWTASGSGTSEYYLRTAASGNPGFVAQPAAVYVNSVLGVEGTAGSLAAGQWDYADNDALGYSTLYYRGSDPDTLAAGYIKFNQLPQNGEDVTIPEGSGAITSNCDGLAAKTIRRWVVQKSNDNRAHGSVTDPIRIDPDTFIFEGGGQTPAYYDLTSAAIAIEIRSTASVDADEFGLYLAGTAVTVAEVQGGSVAFGFLPAQTFTCTTGIRTRGSSARVFIGVDSVVPLLENLTGTTEVENSIANIEVDGGVVRTKRACAVSGAVTVTGGTWYEQSTGTKTAVTQTGGTIDCTQAGGAVIWSAYTPTAGTLRDDPDRLTITSVTRPTAAGTHTWVR
jgi:hypothetical protein